MKGKYLMNQQVSEKQEIPFKTQMSTVWDHVTFHTFFTKYNWDIWNRNYAREYSKNRCYNRTITTRPSVFNWQTHFFWDVNRTMGSMCRFNTKAKF